MPGRFKHKVYFNNDLLSLYARYLYMHPKIGLGVTELSSDFSWAEGNLVQLSLKSHPLRVTHVECRPSIDSLESSRKKNLEAVPSLQSSRTFVRPQYDRNRGTSCCRPNELIMSTTIMLKGIASAEVCFKCRLLETSFDKIYVFY